MADIKQIAQAALLSIDNVLNHWCAGGKRQGHEYVTLNPTRSDNKAGSFSVNLNTGAWADFATSDKGGDLVALVAYIDNVKMGEAAKRLAQFLGIKTDKEDAHKRATSLQNSEGNTSISATQNKKPIALTGDDGYVCVMPVPGDAPAPPNSHMRHGKPSKRYEYLTLDGLVNFYHDRYEAKKDGEKKQFAPLTFWRNENTAKGEWRYKAPPANRPLYGLPKLAALPDTHVWIVEGEKAADALAALMPNNPVVCWQGGAQAVAKADFSVLAGRDCIVWPDNDQPGINAAFDVAHKLKTFDAKAVKTINLNALAIAVKGLGYQLKLGDDAHDLTHAGIDNDRLLSVLNSSEILVEPEGKGSSPAQASIEVQDTWLPMLLPSSIRTPDIQASILPSWAGAMVEAVAKDTQTPPAASVLLALSTIATCVQRRFEVAPYGDSSHTEPLCIWTLSALPSGSRKTSILSSLSKPLKKWEKLLADRTRASIASNEAARRVAKKRIEKLEADAAKAKDSNERQNIRDEISREIEETPEEMHAPRLVTGDVTPERLQELLVEQKERLTLMSDEAGIFLVLGGMYSGGQANLDIFLQAYSGSSVMVDRKSRKAYLEKPALTFGLAIQPDVLQDVANNKRFHDSGLLARFLYCLPQSTVGTRDVRARNPIPDDVAQAWHDGLHDLLEDAEKRNVPPRVLHFTSEATDIWLDFAQKVENELSIGGALSQFTEWGAKLAGQAARVAGLIQIVMTGRNCDRVELEAVKRSIELMGLLVRHAKSTFQLLGADNVEADAIALMAWIRVNGLDEVERSRIQRELSGRFRTVSRLKDAAERLAEWNVLSIELSRKNKGARSTPYYKVNPKLFTC